jgi:hypothetical protein
MRHEVQKAIQADKNNNHGTSSEQLASSAKTNSYILGIGDPENYHPYEVPCPNFDAATWVRPATEVSLITIFRARRSTTAPPLRCLCSLWSGHVPYDHQSHTSSSNANVLRASAPAKRRTSRSARALSTRR